MCTAPARLLGSGPKRSRKLPKLQATHFPSRPGREHWTPIRKSCILQKLSAPVAQGIEYWPPKPRVARSIRAGRATSPSWWGLHVRIHPCPAYPHHRPLPAGRRCPGFGLRHRTLLHCRHPAGLAAHAAGRRHAGGCSPRRLTPPPGVAYRPSSRARRARSKSLSWGSPTVRSSLNVSGSSSISSSQAA